MFDKKTKDQMRKAIYDLDNKYTISHIGLIVLNTLILIGGMILAVIINDISKTQVANIDNNIAQITNNDGFMQPILVLLVMSSLMLVFGLAHSGIFTSKLLPKHVANDMRRQSIHNIIFPLLYEFLYLFSEDIMKSCSAEIIVLAITIMLIFSFLQLLYTLRQIMIDNAIFVHADAQLKDDDTDRILNMLQSIYDRQKEERNK